MLSSNADPRASGGATYRMLRELGARAQPAYAAIREPGDLVVAQRFVRGATLDAEALALLLRDARGLAKNGHANIARVRHVDLAGTELTIATELLDGETLADLLVAAAPETNAQDSLLPLPVLVRILLDVLGGLHALHHVCDGMNVPIGAIHGQMSPASIVVGKDGVTRIIDVLRPRPVRVAETSAALDYAAPEARAAAGTEDPRADVYAVGVILWEALAGHRRAGETAAPPIAPSSPFAPLSDVAMRALALDPALRFGSAAEMASELRKVAGTRVAPGSAVAARVEALAGERIRLRRTLLEPASGTQALSPPAPRRSMTVRASPRVAAPTVAAEIPEALLAASRHSEPPGPDEVAFNDDDEELPGPRGSSPELDLEAVLAEAIAVGERSHAARPAFSPVAPNVSAHERPEVLVARRAPPQGANETPGELVVPVPMSERPARRSGGRAALLVMAAVVMIAGGASVALRMNPRGASAPPSTGPTELPPAATELLPWSAPPVTATASGTPATPAPTSQAATARPPAPLPSAKPKKSVYDPE